MGKLYKLIALACFLALLCTSAFATNDVPTAARLQPRTTHDDAAQASATEVMPPASSVSMTDYVLGVGDRLRLVVYGEDDLSGEYEISSTGLVALPLIGQIQASGQTVRRFEEAVREKLLEGYLHDPRVSVQVINYRPFFILGEVTKPGSYPYVNGMTVLNAVALASGYTYRADKDDITIVHGNSRDKKEEVVPETAVVAPGDIIRVPERIF